MLTIDRNGITSYTCDESQVLVVDLNPEFIAECHNFGLPAVVADFFEFPGILVSPANSYGFMDGGLDALIEMHYPGIQETVQSAVAHRFGGLIPVGSATQVSIDSDKHPALIVAPTMMTPATNLQGTVNAWLATRAAWRCYNMVNWFGKQDFPLILPGMGTGSGRMNYRTAARQMAQALLPMRKFDSWHDAKDYERWLAS